MARRDVKLLGSLIDYVLDVKPYHTKLREFASEIIFNDNVNVNITENFAQSIHFKNVWTRDDLGGYRLSNIVEGIETDRYFRIPATIFPRWSINDSLHYGQTPKGDDPAVIDLTDWNNDGVPDSHDPYVGDPNSSHFLGWEWIPVRAIIERTTIDVKDVVVVGNRYDFIYDMTMYVNADLESYYGFGNYYKVFVNGADYTSLTERFSFGASYDEANFEGLPYDSGSTAYIVRDLQGSYTLTPDDIEHLPGIGNKFATTVAYYGWAKTALPVEIQYEKTGRYKVPFHQGSRVYVEGQRKQYGVDYLVESSRDFIQFRPGRHPQETDTVTVNLMKSDRLFISITPPFDYDGLSGGYDIGEYDTQPYDFANEFLPAISGGWNDRPYDEMPFEQGIPEAPCDYFILGIDRKYPKGHAPVAFFNSTGTVGKGTLSVHKIYPAAQNGDLYIVCAVGPWLFSVQQIIPEVGPVRYIGFKQMFDDGRVAFMVDRVWLNYYMVPDNNTYASYPESYELYPFVNLDPTDYLTNLDLKTEHGVVVDPHTDGRHFPVEIQSIGKIRKRRDETLTASIRKIGGDAALYPDFEADYYEFALNEVPIRGTYYELMVEQNGGLNPYVRTSIQDKVTITVFHTNTDEIQTVTSQTWFTNNEPGPLPSPPPEVEEETPTPTPIPTPTPTPTVSPTPTPTPTPTPVDPTTLYADNDYIEDDYFDEPVTSVPAPTPVSPGVVEYVSGENTFYVKSGYGTDGYFENVPTAVQGVFDMTINTASDVVPINSTFARQFNSRIWQDAPRGDAIPGTWNAERPEWCYNIRPWIYVQEGVGNTSSNTRVLMRNLRVFFLRNVSKTWVEIDNTVAPYVVLYNDPEVFVTDDPTVIAPRYESGGGLSIKPNSPMYFKGWGKSIDFSISPNDIAAVYVTADVKLVVDDTEYTNDINTAKLVAQVGADWNPGAGVTWSTGSAPGIGNGRMTLVTKDMQRIAMVVPNISNLSVTYDDILNNPPPL